MKTANKVIDDRILILDKYLNEPNVPEMNKDNATLTREHFKQIKLAIEEYSNLLNAGVYEEDLVDKIKELVGQTIVPLIERNKQLVDNYKQKMFSLHQKSKEIQDNPDYEGSVALKTELNDVNETILEYNKAKKDTVDYIDEYQMALTQITELIEKEPFVEPEIKELKFVEPEEINEDSDSSAEKNENGEFPV